MHKPIFKEESEFILLYIYENLKDLNAKFNQVWISAGGKVFAIIIQFSRSLMKLGLHEIYCILPMRKDLNGSIVNVQRNKNLCHRIYKNAVCMLKQIKH